VFQQKSGRIIIESPLLARPPVSSIIPPVNINKAAVVV